MKQNATLLSAVEIADIIEILAGEIADDFAGRQLQLLGLLKGCQPFMADLSRALCRLNLSLAIFYLHARSYIGRQPGGMVKLTAASLVDNLSPTRPILLLDDIFDTGETIRQVAAMLKSQGFSEVKVCVLLQKKGREDHAGLVDYCGTLIPDKFVVGYGLDYQEKFRELPYLMILPPEEAGYL